MNISNMKLFSVLALACVMSFGMAFAKLSHKKVTKKTQRYDHGIDYTMDAGLEDELYKPKVLCIRKDRKPKLVDLDVAIEELETKLRNQGVDVDSMYENFDFDIKNKRDAKKIYSWARALRHFKKAAVQIKDGAIIVAWLTADFIKTKIYPLVFVDPIEQLEQVKQIVGVAQEAGDLMESVGLIEGKKRYDEDSDREYATMLQQLEYEHVR